MIKLLFFLALGYMAIRLIRSWFRIDYVVRTARGFQEGLRGDRDFEGPASSSGREKDITDRARTLK